MAPQPLEKTESAPGNGMGSEASNLLDLVHGGGWPIGLTERWGSLKAAWELRLPGNGAATA